MRSRVVCTFLLLALALAGAGAPSAASAQAGERCFAETGQCISGVIRTFWEQNGGLAVFGLPISPLQTHTGEGGMTVQAQWFERHRLELHPENADPYKVLLGRVGVERLAQAGRSPQSLPPFDPNNADAENCRFFSETGHQVCGPFLQAFRSNGLSFPGRAGITFEESLALFGLPLSEAMTEFVDGKEYTVQWFERARFELHPENQPPFNVLFGRLGAELGGGQSGTGALQGREWRLVSFGAADRPTPAATIGRPATLRFEDERVSGSTGCNSFGGGYTAGAGTITFGPLVSTLAACAEEAINTQEQAIFTALQGEVAYTVSGQTLTISYDQGRQALTYSLGPVGGAASSLVGRAWRLIGFGATTGPTTPAPDAPATLSFDGQSASGSTGCNSFSGGYTADAVSISFGPLAATAAACTGELLAAQEQAIFTALQGEVAYTVRGQTLTITYDEGRQALTYAAPAILPPAQP